MGLLRDALNLGYINLDDYNDMASSWSDYGFDVRHYGDTEALQHMVEDFAEMGFGDLAEKAFNEMQSSIDHYRSEYDNLINYNTISERWYSTETGRFVPDPYEWIRD